MISYFKNPTVLIATVSVISIVAVGGVFYSVSKKPSNALYTVSRGTVTESVTATGKVQAAQTIDLSFEKGGKVTAVKAVVGTSVVAGTLLAQTDNTDLFAQLEQAQGTLKVQQAKLDSLQIGTRPELLAIAQNTVTGAQTVLSQSKEAEAAAVRDAYIKADDAIHNKVDVFFVDPRTISPALTFVTSSSQLEINLKADRVMIENLLRNWQGEVLTVSGDDANLSSAVDHAKANLTTIGKFLSDVNTALVEALPSGNVTVSTISTYQGSVTTARVSLSAALSSVISTETARKGAETALQNAQGQLTLSNAGATAEDKAAQQAQVDVALAGVHAVQAQLAKTIIRAPIDGVITKNDAHIGEIANQSEPLISMISNARFEIETFVSEADIAKVAVGNMVEVRLDAYQGATTFKATVIAVDPAATVVNGVSAYKVTVQFTDTDPQIKAGLTANVTMYAQEAHDVITVPESAIITKGTNQFVLRVDDTGLQSMTAVTVGLHGANGMVQIIAGISEGDRVVTFGSVAIK